MISLIIPMYNSEKTIGKTLQSVVNQTIAFSEVIVVDNGSSDQSIQIVEEFMQRYPYIRLLHCKKRGVSSARNMGIDASRSPYVGFLDADDILTDDYVKTIEYSIKRHPDVQMHHFNFQQQFKSGIIKENPYFLHDKEMYTGREFMEKTLKRFSFEAKHMVWTFIFKKEFLNQYHLRFNTEMTIFEDILFLHQSFEKSECLIINEVNLVTYSWNGHSITNNRNSEKQLFENLSILYSQSFDNLLAIRYLEQLTSRLLCLTDYLVFWKQNSQMKSLLIYRQFMINKIKYFIVRIKRKICR